MRRAAALSSSSGITRAAGLRSSTRRADATLLSSLGLIAGRVASMGLGFVAWLVAARLFAPADVGLASAAVAAMMLCVQLGLLGIGSALIALYPRHATAPAHLVNTALTSVTLATLAVAVGALLFAAGVLAELGAIASAPLHVIAFLAMTVFGGVNTLYDYVSIAERRGHDVLVRNVAFGLVTIGGLFGLALVLPGSGMSVILLAWAAAAITACVIAAIQVARSAGSLRPRLSFDPGLTRSLARTGFPNWLLTLTERAPALAMPILVTELLSPETNAFWYAIWMMGWVVLIIPISVGQSLFADLAHRPSDLGAVVRRSIRTALGLGIAAAIGLGVLAHFALLLMGPAYAEAGATPLRILLFTLVPFTIIQAYYAICRARAALTEAILVGAIGGMASVVAAITAGSFGGLVAMALAWVCVQAIVGAYALIRMRALLTSPPASVAPGRSFA